MVQGFSPIGSTPLGFIPAGYTPNYGGYSNNYMFQGPQQYGPQQAPASEKKGSNIAKNVLKTVGTVAVIAGGLVLANKQGWVKQVENPTKAWDKVQNQLAKSGDGIEKKVLSWYNKANNFVKKKNNTEQIIQSAGLDKVG